MVSQEGVLDTTDAKNSGKSRLLLTSTALIRIPKHMIKWKLPLVYTIESVERDGDKIVIVIKVVAEGVGHE